MYKANVAVRNDLGSPVVNVTIEHLDITAQPAIHHWQSVEPGQQSESRPIAYGTGVLANDYWIITWSTQDGNIICDSPRSTRFKQSRYIMHNLRHQDSNKTTLFSISVGGATPQFRIESVSDISTEEFSCVWSNGTGAVDEASHSQYGLIHPPEQVWSPIGVSPSGWP